MMVEVHKYLLKVKHIEHDIFKINSKAPIGTGMLIRFPRFVDEGDTLIYIGASGGPGSTEERRLLHGTIMFDTVDVEEEYP